MMSKVKHLVGNTLLQMRDNNTPNEQKSELFDLFVGILLLPINLVHYSISSSSGSLDCFGTPHVLPLF